MLRLCWCHRTACNASAKPEWCKENKSAKRTLGWHLIFRAIKTSWVSYTHKVHLHEPLNQGICQLFLYNALNRRNSVTKFGQVKGFYFIKAEILIRWTAKRKSTHIYEFELIFWTELHIMRSFQFVRSLWHFVHIIASLPWVLNFSYLSHLTVINFCYTLCTSPLQCVPSPASSSICLYTETCSISKSQGHAEANEWLSHVPWTHMDLFLVLTTSKSWPFKS